MIKYVIYSLYNTNIYIINLDLQLKEVKKALKNIPEYMYGNTNIIYIHNSQDLKDKNLDSIHNNDGSIEINSQSCKNVKSLLKLLIHELYHSVEHDLKLKFVASYNNVITEYKHKKQVILDKIKSDKQFEAPKQEYYSLVDYTSDFDDYLVNRITYPVLFTRITDIFPTPYAITSISEYIAVGFEIFLFENKEWVNIYSPQLYELLTNIINYIE